MNHREITIDRPADRTAPRRGKRAESEARGAAQAMNRNAAANPPCVKNESGMRGRRVFPIPPRPIPFAIAAIALPRIARRHAHLARLVHSEMRDFRMRPQRIWPLSEE